MKNPAVKPGLNLINRQWITEHDLQRCCRSVRKR